MEQLLKTWKLRMVKYRQEADNANTPITRVKAMNNFFIYRDCIKELEEQLTIPVVGCQREQLKTTKEPLPYDEWKKHLKIQKPNNQIYQIGDEYITLNEVLEMYEDYYHSF